MKSDIEIAREANMQPIQTVAEKLLSLIHI